MDSSASLLRRFGPKLLVSLVLGAGFVLLMMRGGFPIIPPAGAFARTHLWVVVLYVLMIIGVHWLRAWRWVYLLRPMAEVAPRKIIAAAWVGFLAILLFPFRMGEVVRPYLIRERGKVSLSAAFGTIALERVLDGLILSLMLAACLLLLPQRPDAPPWVAAAGYATLALFVTALAVLLALLRWPVFTQRAVRRLGGFFSPKLGDRFARIAAGLIEGLSSLPNPRMFLPFLGYTLAYWALNGFGMWVLAKGTGLDLSVAQAYAVMGILAVGILLPTAPGLFGAFQYSVFIALGLYLPPSAVRTQGAAYIFLVYTTQFVWHVIAGGMFLFTEHISLRAAFGGTAERVSPPSPAA